jgi:hypothetical protein
LSVLEAAVGLALVLAVAAGFAVDVPAPDEREVTLETYAGDVGTLLRERTATDRGRLAGAATRSVAAFERNRDRIARTVDGALPDSLFYRVVTPHGAVGFERPAGVSTGRTTVSTADGDVHVWVWSG